jgi:cob(I)alamin adenosyltransferase
VKIYTKVGDKGKTSLLGGKVVSKNHLRIEAYGSVDELVSFCGLLKDTYSSTYYYGFLSEIQSKLMAIASLLATDDPELAKTLPSLKQSDINSIEREIDKMEKTLAPLRYFIIPGGNIAVSTCHLVRTVCRRAERVIISLSELEEVNDLILIYLNRLSDFFFVLARLISNDLNVQEVRWNPSL